jgi:hypothetical protein
MEYAIMLLCTAFNVISVIENARLRSSIRYISQEFMGVLAPKAEEMIKDLKNINDKNTVDEIQNTPK